MSQRTRVPFSLEEDNRLISLVTLYGEANWAVISSFMAQRSARQCRERFVNWLKCSQKVSWTPEEDSFLLRKVSEIGQHWKEMEIFFPGRVSYEIRNRYKKLSKKSGYFQKVRNDVEINKIHEIETNENNEIKTIENNVIETNDNNEIKTIGNNVIETNENNEIKTNENNEIKTNENNEIKTNENNEVMSIENNCSQNETSCCKKKCCANKATTGGVFDGVTQDEEPFEWSNCSWCRCVKCHKNE